MKRKPQRPKRNTPQRVRNTQDLRSSGAAGKHKQVDPHLEDPEQYNTDQGDLDLFDWLDEES